MKRYEINRVGDASRLYVEEADILEVRPLPGDKLHALELTIRNRDVYTIEAGFRYDSRTRTVRLRLNARQAAELIEQDRAGGGKFCEPCYDYGASPFPEDCARCRTIQALHMAGLGDGRKVRIPLPSMPSRAMPVVIALLLAAFWLALLQWSKASAQLEQARQEISLLRRTKGR